MYTSFVKILIGYVLIWSLKVNNFLLIYIGLMETRRKIRVLPLVALEKKRCAYN